MEKDIVKQLAEGQLADEAKKQEEKKVKQEKEVKQPKKEENPTKEIPKRLEDLNEENV